MTRGRTVALVGAGVVVVAAVGGIVWWSVAAGSADPAAAPTASASAISDADAAAAALELMETDPAALLPDELEAEWADDVDAALPDGTDVVADPATWRPSSFGGGVIEAQLRHADGTSERIGIVMVQEEGSWRVLQTVPLEGDG